MPRFIAEKALLLQLLEDKQDQTLEAILTRTLVRAAKRTHYDSVTRRLTFTLADRAAAFGWHSKDIEYRGSRLRLQCPTILEREDSPLHVSDNYAFGGDPLRYQVRVLATGVSAGAIEALLSASVDCSIVSVARAPLASAELYDSNFFLVTFDTPECPQPLRQVTHISAPGLSLFLHHFRQYQRVPCFGCYSPFHTISRCTGQDVTVQSVHHRNFSKPSHSLSLVPELTLTHLDVEGRLAHIQSLSSSLNTTKEKLHEEARTTPLLVRMSVPPDHARDDSMRPERQPPFPVSSARSHPYAQDATDSGMAPRPTDGWFDPGDGRKRKTTKKSDIHRAGKHAPPATAPKEPTRKKVTRATILAKPGPTHKAADRTTLPQPQVTLPPSHTDTKPTKSTPTNLPPRPVKSSSTNTAARLNVGKTKQFTAALAVLNNIRTGTSVESIAPITDPILGSEDVTKLSVKRAYLSTQTDAITATLVDLRSVAATARDHTSLAKAAYHDTNSVLIEKTFLSDPDASASSSMRRAEESTLLDLEHRFRVAVSEETAATEAVTRAEAVHSGLVKKLSRLPPSKLPIMEPLPCAVEPLPTISDTPDAIDDRLRQHSREAILGFVLTFMRKRRQKGDPATSRSSAEAYDSESMDHTSASAGITAVSPNPFACTSEDGAVHYANSSLGDPAADVDIDMESVYMPQNTMRLDELGDTESNNAGLSPDTRDPAFLEDKVPIPAALAATFESDDPPNPQLSAPGMDPVENSPSFELTIFHGHQLAARASDKHARTLTASRVRKSPLNASPMIAAAALTEGSRCAAANLLVIKKWVKNRSCVVSIPHVLPTTASGQNEWIRHCTAELVGLVMALPFPIQYLKCMTPTTLKTFGHAINSETQLAVIRRYATHADLELNRFCSSWDAVASQQLGVIRWKTTDSIQRWRKVHKLHPELLCATVVDPIATDDWAC